jgi:hypothetical protein
MDPEVYERLTSTIRRDCLVLESFKIMDYSLLVGIHRPGKGTGSLPVTIISSPAPANVLGVGPVDEEAPARERHVSADGGFRSVHQFSVRAPDKDSAIGVLAAAETPSGAATAADTTAAPAVPPAGTFSAPPAAAAFGTSSAHTADPAADGDLAAATSSQLPQPLAKG